MNAQVDHRASEADGEERPHDDIRPDDAPADADAAGPDEIGPDEAGPPETGSAEAGPDETHAVAPVEPPPVEEWPSAPVVVQDAPTASPAALRVDFGAHLEANYQRLVAQLYAITLDAGEAHDVVQDAYSRAWRKWAEIGAGPDPTGWVRRVAVRSTQRGWRRVLERVGLARPRPVGDGDPRTAALLAALGRLGIAERRAVVLFHMVGMSRRDIAALEQVSAETLALRLRRAHQAVTEGMADELPSVLGVPATYDDPYTPHTGAERQYRWTP
ncbi:RNA polymerase sigma factor [Pseudonocardia saturnea]